MKKLLIISLFLIPLGFNNAYGYCYGCGGGGAGWGVGAGLLGLGLGAAIASRPRETVVYQQAPQPQVVYVDKATGKTIPASEVGDDYTEVYG